MTVAEAHESVRAYDEGEAAVVATMSAINAAIVSVVETISMLLVTNGWAGWGIRSPEHWVQLKANVSSYRAAGLVLIARRRGELPACWALFAQGRLTEDAMVRIARRVPTSHDDQVAALAPGLLISQLTRVLAVLPELHDSAEPGEPERAAFFRRYTRPDGSECGEYDLPADQAAAWALALDAARDAEFRDRNDLPPDTEVGAEVRTVSWIDAALRMASEATDALDSTLARTGHRGERHQVVLHHHVDHQGHMGPGRLHLGGFVTEPVARYLACDATVITIAYRNGKLLGINPAERTPNRRLRRYLEHRDGGCVHPLCTQKRWLHAHHLQHWEDGGPTEPGNLVCLCPSHHRALHHGDFTIVGNPEHGDLVFHDARGRRIEPPAPGAAPLPPPTQPTYRPPFGERLNARDFSWNSARSTSSVSSIWARNRGQPRAARGGLGRCGSNTTSGLVPAGSMPGTSTA